MGMAIERRYPKKLPTWKSVSDNEKELFGIALEKVEEKEKRFEHHWGKIVEIVNDVIGKNELREFITNGGNAKSSLYNPVSRKYPEIPLDTLKKWLNKRINDGDLEKDLKKLTKD